jgi:hypothetical protein
MCGAWRTAPLLTWTSDSGEVHLLGKQCLLPTAFALNLAALLPLPLPLPLLPPQVPGSIAGIMRPYQVEGVAWLGRQYAHGMGGVLADDMVGNRGGGGCGSRPPVAAVTAALGVVCPPHGLCAFGVAESTGGGGGLTPSHHAQHGHFRLFSMLQGAAVVLLPFSCGVLSYGTHTHGCLVQSSVTGMSQRRLLG